MEDSEMRVIEVDLSREAEVAVSLQIYNATALKRESHCLNKL